MKLIPISETSVNHDADVPQVKHSLCSRISQKFHDLVEVVPGDNRNGLRTGTSRLNLNGYFIDNEMYERILTSARRFADEDLYLDLTGEILQKDVSDSNVDEIATEPDNSTEGPQKEGENQPDTPITSGNQVELTKENPQNLTQDADNDLTKEELEEEEVHQPVRLIDNLDSVDVADMQDDGPVVDEHGRDEFKINENLELVKENEQQDLTESEAEAPKKKNKGTSKTADTKKK
jgi:hypothetical protein